MAEDLVDEGEAAGVDFEGGLLGAVDALLGGDCARETDDLAQEVDEFIPVLPETSAHPHQDAVVLLVVQEHLRQFPLLLLRQVAVALDYFDFLQFLVLRQLLVALRQFLHPHLKTGQGEDPAHLPQVVVDEMLFETGAFAEEAVALVDAVEFLVEHEVGLPAAFLLQFLERLFLGGEDGDSFVAEFHVG